jgi:NAD(P)-dependent dehydrogenase (short-subunit alcohol dehydrogenase family)
VVLSLVTGVAKKGQVGEAVASAFAARGDTTLVVSRSDDDARARAAELGPNAFGYACDLANAAEVERLAQRVQRQHGQRLDALVHAAGGFAMSGPIATSDPDVFRNQLEISLVTAYLMTRAFFTAVQAARGSIVFFASEAVVEGSRTAEQAGYAAAKSAVIGLMRSVADEGRAFGVRANALAPSAIRTATNVAEMGADKRFVEREDVAAAVAFLCSDAARAITGQVIRLR